MALAPEPVLMGRIIVKHVAIRRTLRADRAVSPPDRGVSLVEFRLSMSMRRRSGRRASQQVHGAPRAAFQRSWRPVDKSAHTRSELG
jgi:hypothetical protein